MKKHIPGAAHPVLPASTAVHGTSQTTTTSGATHSLQEPLLLCPSEIQHPLNSGKGEGWTSWWSSISLWLFKYNSHVLWRQVFHRDHGCAEPEDCNTCNPFPSGIFTSGPGTLLECDLYRCQWFCGKSLTFSQPGFFLYLFTSISHHSSFLQWHEEVSLGCHQHSLVYRAQELHQ